MLILEDIRYRCALCGEPLMRDGGNRHEAGQQLQVLMCINGSEMYGPNGKMCPNFGIRMRMPLKYMECEQA